MNIVLRVLSVRKHFMNDNNSNNDDDDDDDDMMMIVMMMMIESVRTTSI